MRAARGGVTAPLQPPVAAGERPDAQRLIASLPQALLVLAPDLTLAAVNPAAEALLGASASRVLRRTLVDVLAFDEPLVFARLGEGEANLVARDCRVAILGQAPRRLDLVAAPVLHHPGWQMLLLEPVVVDALNLGPADPRDDGTVLRAPDVLAHEIKNPLAGIRGAAQLLDRRVDSDNRALTQLITREVDRIAALIDQMQSLSRRGTGPSEPCNLHEAVRHARAIMLAGQGTAPAPLLVEAFDPSLPAVDANRDALVQVLLNLLVNARDACAASARPQIVVRTRFASGIQLHHARDGRPLRLPIELRVSDNGPGVPPALGDHIFEPFVSTKPTGQGLGLALVQKLVRDMHGRVSHDRDETAGLTHFRLHLPVAGSVRHESDKP